MSLQILEEKNKNQYQEAVESLTQSWSWGDFRKATGVRVIRAAEFNNSTLKYPFQIFFHKIPHTNLNVGYLPRPKIINKEIIAYLKKLGQENNAIYIKVEPDEMDGHRNQDPELRESKAILPKHTIFIDLTKTEEELLKAMHEKTRYNIKVAQKQEVIVSEKNDDQSLENFLKILEGTKARQGFYSHPPSYFRKLWNVLKGEKMVHLLLAEYKTEPLAGLLLLHFKDKLYYVHGGSSEIHREKMPNHLLHLEAIKLGKKLGCKIYDLWGSYLERPESSDPWFGVYRFKSGFGGKEVTYVGGYDLVINPLLYKFYNLADFTRWKLLRLKAFLIKK